MMAARNASDLRPLFTALLLTGMGGGVGAQQGIQEYDPHDYVVRAVRIQDALQIDGRLDEAAWVQADPATGFIQRNPDEGAPATERTEIRILYDAGILYIGARMFASDPDALVVTQMRRDSRLHGDEYLDVVLDTFHDHRNAFQFQINPAGARFDAYITDEGRNVNSDFNVVWDAATRIDDRGWSAEIAIPLNQLRFPNTDGEQVWGVNFYRNIRHNNEEAYWVPSPRDLGYRAITRLSNAGRLLGLEGLRSGRNVQVKPYAMGGVARERERYPDPGESADATDGVGDAGLDVKIGVTPNMTLDLTFNTDFAQVEADQERVNLTRFSLFFPEKRDFFLEGAGIFSSGGGGGGPGGFGGGGMGGFGRGPDLQLFYSRNIGLAMGEEVPIVGGGKLTGRMGPWTLGVMNVLTDRERLSDGDLVEQTLWSVVSLRRNILSRSSIGLLAASKDPLHGTHNRTVGLDANLALGQTTSITGQVAQVFDPAILGDAIAYTGQYRWDTDLWQVRLEHRRVGEEFDSETGYVRRTDLKETEGEMEFSPRPGVLGIRQLSFSTQGSYLTDMDNRLETRNFEFQIRLFMDNTSNHFITFQREFDLLPDDYTAYTDPDTDEEVVLPAGPYEWNDFSIRVNTDGRVPIVLRGGGGISEWYGGRRVNGNVDLSWRPDARLSASINYSLNMVRDLPVLDPAGRDGFDTKVISLRLNYAFNPNLFTKAYLQYNDARNAIVSNYLLHWIVRDGTELYLVYNEQWDTGLEFDPFPTDRTLMLKATYLLLW
jgi:hypothetical protein